MKRLYCIAMFVLGLAYGILPACAAFSAEQATDGPWLWDAAPPTRVHFNYCAGNPAGAALDANTVRAEIAQDNSQLPGGPLAEGVPGDFVLKNNLAAFTIAGVRPGSGVNPFGGVVEDAAILYEGEDGSLRWHNAMGTGGVFPVFFLGSEPLMGMRVFAPIKAEILKDGSDGEAVVRVTGRDASFDVLNEMLGRNPAALRILITIDYILRPDSRELEIRTSIENKNKKALAVNMGYGVLVGDGVRPFAPGPGFDEDAFTKNGPYPFVAAAGPSVSYAWVSKGAQIKIPLILSKHIITVFDTLRAKPDESASVSHYWIVGNGDVASVAWRSLGIEPGKVSGRVSNASGAPVADAVVSVLDAEGDYLNMAHVDGKGRFALNLPQGEYVIRATSETRTDAEPQTITVKNGHQELSFTMSDSARLHIDIGDSSLKNIPVTVSLKPVDPVSGAANGKYYRMKKYGGGFSLTHFSASGNETIEVKPGKYDVYVSRGLEYEYVKKTIEAEAGAEAYMSVVLPRVVDTAGWLCGDFHLHAESSHDSSDLLIWKVAGLAAAGVEIPVATDHDRVTDYDPAIRELGLEREIKAIKGDEISTPRLGHFNAFPLTYDPAAPNQGAIAHMGLSPAQLFQASRDNNPAPRVVQINHPRTPAFGYFAYIDYDPQTASSPFPDLLSFDYDAIEVLNGTWYGGLPDTLLDWFSRLDRGHRVTGTGNSDSHRIFTLEAGYPRNCVRSPTDIPGDMDEPAFIQSVLKQQVTVMAGPFITASISGKSFGETVTAKGGRADLDITVQAPSWLTFDKVTVLVGGKETASFNVQGRETPVRFKRTVPISAAADTWVVVVAEGADDLFPVYPGAHSYSFTNPIYLDVDGNGEYDAPVK